MIDLNPVVAEFKEIVEKVKLKGATPQEVREHVVTQYDLTAQIGLAMLIDEVMESAEAGAFYAHSVNTVLGGVNAVLIEQALSPVHISELPFINENLVSTLEEFTGESIDQVLEKVEAHLKGGLN